MKRIRSLLVAGSIAATPQGMVAQAAQQLRLPPADAKLDFEFSAILSARELRDGRLLVADGTEGKVFVADFGRATVGPVGRNGQGPGEYQAPGPLLPIGSDSTLMVEQRNGRWHLLSGATIAATLAPDDNAVVAAHREATAADGTGNVYSTMGVRVAKAPPTLAMMDPESLVVLRVRRRDAHVDTVATVKNAPRHVDIRTDVAGKITSVSIMAPPFVVKEEVVAFEDGWVAIVRVDPYRVDWRAPAGRVMRGRALPWPAVELSEADVAEFLRARTRSTGNAADQDVRLRQQLADAMKLAPERLPPFAGGGPSVRGGPTMPGVLALGDGRLLIRHPETPDHPAARYDVVNRRGALDATLALGKSTWIVAVGRSHAYVAMMDDDGLQYLSRHPWP